MTDQESHRNDQGEVLALRKELLQKDLKIASLQMMAASYQSTMSEAQQRARHSEELCHALSSNVNMEQVAELVIKHVGERSNERAVHQQALMQATVTALSTALKMQDDSLRNCVNNVCQGLTRALGTMHEIQKKESLKQTLKEKGQWPVNKEQTSTK